MRESAISVAALSLPKAFPSSQKKYLTGSRSDLRVPYREITLSPTHHSRGTEENPPLPVYDSSGPFSDPDCSVDVAEGLPKLRRNSIEERSDTELLHGLSSEYGRQRANDLLTFELRFPPRPRPRRARSLKRRANYAVVRTSTVAIGSCASSGRSTSRPSALFVTFNGFRARSANKYAPVTVRGILST
jgi:ThiC-like protein